MRSFELQTYQGGKWKIDSVFDDRELALYEAKRMDGTGRYSGVRVIEEVFVESTHETKTRTIFRGTKVEAVNAAELTKSIEARQRAREQQPARKRTPKMDPTKRAAHREKVRKKANPYRLIFISFLIFFLAIGMLAGLQIAQGYL